MAKEVTYNNTLVSGTADETLTYTRYIKDESSGKSVKESLDEKVNKSDQLGTTQIADNAITNEKLAEQSVDNSKLSQDSVSYDKILNGAVITEKIQDGAVTTEKVEENAITNTKIGDSAVDGRTISEASVEKKHLANDSVATEKLQDSAITSDKIHTDAVTEEKIKDSSVSNSKLADNSVGTSKIKDGNITNEKVANNTLTLDKLDPELRKSIQAATGLPENLVETIQDVDKEVKTLHSKDTDLQSQITDKQQQISAHNKDIELLQTRSTQMERTINNIAATGGASVANTVAYTNTTSGLESVNAQGAIDELAAKNKLQDAMISAKANAEDVSSQMQTEQERVNTEFAKKFDKESILQESGDAEDKVMSQKAVSDKFIDLSKSFPSIFNNGDTYIPLVFAHEFTAINQDINIKLDNLTGDFRLLITTNFVNEFVNHIRIGITDSNGTSYKLNPDFSYKNRFVFDLKNVSSLNKIVFGTFGILAFKSCIFSAVLYNKNAEDFVDIWKDIDDSKADKSEVDSLVKKIEDEISSNEETTIECSESFTCPVGETIQIFYKSIFNGININDFIISCRSDVGKSYPRYFEYKPTETGKKNVTFSICKFDRYEYKVVSTKTVTIECIEHPKSSSKNILIIGDSLTLYDSMQDEILRRINNEGGEPEGYKLTCNFLGRKITSKGTKYEGTSGYNWQKYTNRLGRSFKFIIPSTASTSVGSKYKVQMDDGSSKTLQVIEVNISSTISASSYIKLIFDFDYDDLKRKPVPSGTLVKNSGSGDTNISYTQYETENYSPFLNDNDEIDFRPYFNQYCNGNIDIMIIELGTNDITYLLYRNLNKLDLINDYINVYCKKFISKLHEQYPNLQIVILGLHKCSQNGGMNNVANTSDKAKYCRYLFKWNKALQDLAKENNYTHYIDVNAQFDSENSYNDNITKQVNLRNSKVEPIDSNSVHPITSGLQLIADSVVRYLCKIL